MIQYTRGNLLEAQVDALVNTVNEVGVMGKGIALMFREAYPESAREYQEAAKAGRIRVGQMHVTRNHELVGPRWIIDFPTKKHWRHPSRLEWIREGLRDLARVIGEYQIATIALPPLGCGNGGLEWTQHDVMGEMILCLDTITTDPRTGDHDPSLMPLIERLVTEAIAASAEEDTGLWEFRTLPNHYTFSKVLCWVAAARGARIAARLGATEKAAAWEQWAVAEKERVLAAAYNSERGFFTQSLGGVNPDASNLLLATIGIVDPHDPRFVSTVRAYEQLLTSGGLMQRYRHDDDFGATTSAFTICSFWWAEALAMVGRLDDAVRLFDRLVAYANPLGLFSEDIEPETGRQLGNFPQAYTHVGLIHAAITIGELIDARHGHFRAWTPWR